MEKIGKSSQTMAKFSLTHFLSKPKPKGRKEKKKVVAVFLEKKEGRRKIMETTYQGVKVIVIYLNPFSSSIRFSFKFCVFFLWV